LAILIFQKVIELVTKKFQNFEQNVFFLANGRYAPPSKVGHLKKSSTHAVVLLKSWGLNNSTKFNSFCGIMEHKLDEKYIIITFNKF
jgi:hypothetical protein